MLLLAARSALQVSTVDMVDARHARLFGGSEDGDARASAFTGPEQSTYQQVLDEQAALDELDSDHAGAR